ncbi:MAG: large-conductance mechanosensitive channel protein MscL [Clostridia bacterium]|nr:large-conductance mechanosensitive channel protein MscL [Clostridia bacterium]
MKKFITEFKEFIAKGNVLDMAVGVIIGGAFNKIVTSLVNDVIMPLISIIVGGANVTDWKWVIKEAVIENGVEVAAETAFAYGNFIQAIIDFLIIALTIFVALKVILGFQNAFKKKEEEIIEETPAEPEDTELSLLKEIRDSLKK